MRNLKYIVIIMLLSIMVPSIAHGQYLSYKQTLWGDLKYTSDGIDFENFGGGWGNLLDAVSSVDEARSTLKVSRNCNYAGQVFSAGGGAFLGYAAARESDNKKVEDGIWIAGGAMAITGLIFEIVAKHKLDKGFLIYNESSSRGDIESSGNSGLKLAILPRRAVLVYNF